ncbi:hypothetical protein M4I21_17655 [Cellulophaga sp. 20_2_10]|uniref:hypothetical protein n=1 Tax=Cellulophaga sp. 20_2_10 TaxID=2942476 RepID=UPI00201A41B6|nr:hypothetical protein [Cellulophaga sp. 20_2_10]MCL5247648.1 hypothetical protein [Cellulophaga sp. 20_2_10]
MKIKVLFILFLTIVSCKPQNKSEISLKDFKISEKSKALFPYQNKEDKLIFKDSLGNKITYAIVNFRNYNRAKETTIPSVETENKKTTLKFTKEYQEISLETNSDVLQDFFFELETEFNLKEALDFTEYDCMAFYRGGGSTTGLITDIKSAEDSYILNSQPKNKEQIIINGTTYKNLLEVKNSDIIDFYYSLEKGIIAINEYRDNRKPKYWVLDSIIYKN